jgi:hypothetical protein
MVARSSVSFAALFASALGLTLVTAVACVGTDFATAPSPDNGSSVEAGMAGVDVDNTPIIVYCPLGQCPDAGNGGADGTVEGGESDATTEAESGNATITAPDATTLSPDASDHSPDAPSCNGCSQGQTACVSGGLATCTLGSNGCWAFGTPVGCASAHQTCTVSAGLPACTCKTDPVCTAAGNTCAGSTMLANCGQDQQGCFYASTMLTCTTGLVCERYGGPACVDPNWAEWPMPNGPVDVLAGAPNRESYVDNGDGTVRDNVTGLVWQKAVAPGTYDAQAVALTYCAGLNLGGHTDWRLPSVVELVSLVDPGTAGPSINATFFPGTPATRTNADFFCSSTSYAGVAGGAWYVGFFVGNIYPGLAQSASVRCVR